MTKLSNIKLACWFFYVVILSLSPPGNAQTYLFNRADFPIGTNPTRIVVADLNRDGNLDLVLGDSVEGSVSILLGKKDGTFAKRIVYTGFDPAAVAVGDFNGDGKPDIAVSNLSSNTVSILLGNGNGTFQAAMSFGTSVQPLEIVVADFNRDGKLDVAVNHNSGTSISVLLGNGDGTLQGYVDYVVPSGSNGIVAADFNRDGKVDLALAGGWANAVNILFGNGDGTFQPSTSVPAGALPLALAVGDVNGDGFLDLVVSNGPICGCGSVSVVLGNGDGTFRPPLTIALPGRGGDIVVGDFNGDHKLDFGVISSPAYSGVIYVFLGNGDGTFQVGGQFGPDHSADALAAADFNHDGILDLAVATFNGNNATAASVLLGNGDGTFGKFSTYPTAQQSTSIVSADLNGDGSMDLAALDPSFQTVAVLLNTGQGTFKKSVLYPVGNAGQQGEIIVRDFNGDSKPDLVVTDFLGGTISVLLNLGNGTFASHADYPAGSNPETLVPGDFNGDGKLDLVVGGLSGLYFLAGNGNGGFSAPVVISSTITPYSLAVGDFNNDGKLDLAVVNGSGLSNYVSVFVGNGNGTFAAPVNYTAGSQAVSVVAADLNGDGKIDLAVASSIGISVLLGNGNGTFQAHTDYSVGGPAGLVRAVDLSGTGKLDLASMVSNTDPRLKILRANGNGTFQPFADYYVGNGLNGIGVGDFDGNGTQDLAITNSIPYSNTVTAVLSTPVIALSPSALKFAAQTVGTISSPKLETISNPSSIALKLQSITIAGPNAGDFHKTATCGTGLSGTAHCTISISFQPTAKGTRTASLQIIDNGLGRTQTIALTGKGR